MPLGLLHQPPRLRDERALPVRERSQVSHLPHERVAAQMLRRNIMLTRSSPPGGAAIKPWHHHANVW